VARSSKPEPISARALVLTNLAASGTMVQIQVTLLIALPDGSITAGHPFLSYSQQFSGVIRPGTWVPVTLVPGEPDTTQLDRDHVPSARAVADVIAEALGGPATVLTPPDPWRITLALGYAEQLIATGVFTQDQAEAIRQRIRRGV